MASICHSLFIVLELLTECHTIVKSRFGDKENITTFVV